MKKLLIPISSLFVYSLSNGQTNTENYIQTRIYLEPVTSTSTTAKQINTVNYVDGLGRPKQVVQVKAAPSGKDLVTHVEYDGFGRQVDSWLHVPMTTLNGDIQSSVKTTAQSFYNDSFPFVHSNLEASPLDRHLSTVNQGAAWQANPVTMNYETNTADEVKKFVATFNYANFESYISISAPYAAGQLYKNSITDEDGNKTIEFKNGQGQTILVRKMLDGTQSADTYYVYNDYNQLAYVIPPLAVVANSVTPVTLDNLCYQYKYDGKNRLVEKKLPGKGWEHMVYDKADRLIALQDAVMRPSGKWLFTKYDKIGRVIMTGIISAANRPDLQAITNNFVIMEERDAQGFNRNGMQIYYTDGLYSNAETILSVNYYDTYPTGTPNYSPSLPGNIIISDDFAQNINTKSLPLASYIKNIEDDNWTKNYTWYDNKGRVIATHSINHLGGYTKIESQLDFSGVSKQIVTRHKRLDADTGRLITENFIYDNQERVISHTHQVDGNAVEYLAQNEYNDILQIKTKKVGGISANSPLQTVDYTYNIRGWMSKINDPTNLGNDFFGYEIKYNNPVYTSLAGGKFNGNITEVDWKTSFDNILKRYNYTYDGLNRLKKGMYAEPDTANPQNGNFDEYMTYDLNGNISNLQRKAVPITGLTSTVIDNLDYEYTGTRLNRIVENAMNDTGYEGGNNIITYDLNGNMKNMLDKNIHAIAYNHLNLPSAYSISQPNDFGIWTNYGLDYLYRADGTKLRKAYRGGGGRGALITNSLTDYLDGFQYSYYEETSCITCRTSVAYEEQAFTNKDIILPPGGGFPGFPPEWRLQFVHTAEGFYSYTENRYIYQYVDHLGNSRISYAKKEDGSLEITDKNNYYPFGLNHIGNGKSNLGGYTNYKYNGKELQETGMYDYGARFYMPDIGRWGVQDPNQESYTNHSSYNYVGNNPIMTIDPDGRDWYYTGDGQYLYNKNLNKDNATQFFKDNNIEGANYAFASNTMGTMNYAADGYIYDDSVAGGGKPVENGRLNNIEGVTITKTNWWNSPLARFLVPDRFGVTQSGSVGGGAEIGTSMGLEVITRGKDAGIYFDPGNTLSIGAAFGAGGEGDLSFFSSTFTGKVSDMSLNTVVGTEGYVSGSLVDVVGVVGKVSVSFDPNPNNGPVSGRWVTRSVGVAAGAKGSVGVGVTLSNTRVGVGFDGKIRVADYTGAVTGKGSY